jgi:hypothetical protein
MKKIPIFHFVAFTLIISIENNVHSQMLVAAYKNSNKLWGYFTSEKKVLCQPVYKTAYPYSQEGIALVSDNTSITTAVSQGGYEINELLNDTKYIDIHGNELKLNFEVSSRKSFHNGRAGVEIKNKWGYIDTRGSLVIPPIYYNISHFSCNRAFVEAQKNILTMIDKNGNIIKLQEQIDDYKKFNEGYDAIRIGPKWGYIDTNGSIVIKPKYDNAGNFSDGLAWVKVGEKLGYINKLDSLVINPEFLICNDFDDESGLARVKSADGWCYIDTIGNKHSYVFGRLFDYSEGLCRASKPELPGLVGFMNKDGNWIIEPKYEAAGDFKNGICRVRINGKWGAIDKSGNYILEPKLSGLHDFELVNSY